MKKYLIYLFTLASTLLIGCDSFRDMSGAAEVNPITVDVYLDITVENISTLKDLTVKFDNYDGKKITKCIVQAQHFVLSSDGTAHLIRAKTPVLIKGRGLNSCYHLNS